MTPVVWVLPEILHFQQGPQCFWKGSLWVGSNPEFTNLSTIDIWGQIIFVVGDVLSIIECLTATHLNLQMPVASPSCVNWKRLQILQSVSKGRGDAKISAVYNHSWAYMLDLEHCFLKSFRPHHNKRKINQQRTQGVPDNGEGSLLQELPEAHASHQNQLHNF